MPDTELPRRLEPMLAKIGKPFDSDDHLFEIKWDGTRVIAYRDRDGYRMHNRRGASQRERYPELAGLLALPPGVVVDGEVIVLVRGRPDFESFLRREQTRGGARAERLARTLPATYMVFDLLYQDFDSLLDRPLVERRERLVEVVQSAEPERVVLSEGVTGEGRAFYEAACERELEGVVAKRLEGRYLPGQRTDSWLKIKRTQILQCAVIGYMPTESGRELRSLIVAAPSENGTLVCVGRVGSGLTDRMREELWVRLQALRRADPIVPCRHAGEWVEPEVFCTVSYLERTRGGELRAPVFRGLLME